MSNWNIVQRNVSSAMGTTVGCLNPIFSVDDSRVSKEVKIPWRIAGPGLIHRRTTPILVSLEKRSSSFGWSFYISEKMSKLREKTITLPKTNMDTQNDGLERVTPYKKWPFLVSMNVSFRECISNANFSLVMSDQGITLHLLDQTRRIP